MKSNPLLTLCAAIAVMLAASCSTTKRIEKGEMLYTGVKTVDIQTPEGEMFPADLTSQIKEAVNVAPNNCLISPSLRYPFPLGLWVYNNWPNPPSGFRHWLYEKLAAEPVLISDVRPDVRTHMIEQLLADNGYFRGRASYELVSKKNKRKASIIYRVTPGSPYVIDSIAYIPDTCRLNHYIDSLALADPYLKVGAPYCIDSLAEVRTRIANSLRNRGYYYFKPEFIEYLADSLINPRHIALKLDLADNLPPQLYTQYRTGDVTVVVNPIRGNGTSADTVVFKRATLIQRLPSKLRQSVIPECIAFRKGRLFTVHSMNTTQTYLSRLGIFNSITMEVYPDTMAAEPTLDVLINTRLDNPLEASIEANVSSKSNSYLGPGLTLGLTNRNIFGGGEQFSIRLTGAYEWQTGHGRSSIFNSYEAGLNTSLSFPRLLAPKFIPRRRRELSWTRITLGADLLNRPHYFKMAQFNMSFGYDWVASRHVNNSLSLFKLTYTNLLKTTETFDSITNANPAIALSFRSQYIPQISYTYTYDRDFDRNNSFNFTFTLQEAGNVFWSIYELCGEHGEKELFGTPFSQFVKGSAQIVYGHRLRGEHWLWGRVMAGAAHAYGNSSQVPYAEQFWVGGANSIRAFTVRSIGPGSYHEPDGEINGYFDQTGTFKFEANLEYRFPIIGPLHGAVFVDAGNVWLLKNDPQRPGGLLQGSSFLKDLALGTGAGLRFDISMLVVRADLGVGIHAPYDTGKSGYYNMTRFKDSLAFHLAIGYPF